MYLRSYIVKVATQIVFYISFSISSFMFKHRNALCVYCSKLHRNCQQYFPFFLEEMHTFRRFHLSNIVNFYIKYKKVQFYRNIVIFHKKSSNTFLVSLLLLILVFPGDTLFELGRSNSKICGKGFMEIRIVAVSYKSRHL